MATPRFGALGVRYHTDERRTFFGDIFPNRDGDINLVELHQGVFVGWHRHQKQDDRLFLVSGVLRLRIFETTPAVDGVEWILTETEDRLPYFIPRNHWHGYEALTDDTVVLQFNGPAKYDGRDEERLSVEEMPWTL